MRLDKGTEFLARGSGVPHDTSPSREAGRKVIRQRGATSVTASSTEVWVEAVDSGNAPVVDRPTQFTISGRAKRGPVRLRELADPRQAGVLGRRQVVPLRPGDRGVPARRRHGAGAGIRRWSLKGGRVLSVSGPRRVRPHHPGQQRGLRPRDQAVDDQPDLNGTFPTYPSLFLMPSGKLFYTGSNAGYGSDTVGRDPGIWDLTITPSPRSPACATAADRDQRQRPAAAGAGPALHGSPGAGGIGESDKSTARTDIIDLREDEPHFGPGPDLESRSAIQHGDHPPTTGS